MLILCEKPSVAKDFASALGASAKKGYFEGGGHIITYCVGHLYELCPPEAYDLKYKNWTIEDLPIIPSAFNYHTINRTAEQASLVISFLLRHGKGDVLIATDAGREGELIARIALREAGITDISRFRRFWVSEALTEEIILSGIKDAKPLSEYDGLSAQAFSRQHSDWLVGMNLSRFMSIGNPPPAFSVGRVQTAVLSGIASRNEEVKKFVAAPYMELEAICSNENGPSIKALLENPKTQKTVFFKDDEEYLSAAIKNCEGNYIHSANIDSQEKRKKPEKLFNITGLQKAVYKKFGYKPEETLNIAQSLYETNKCLSYPRTPSRVMGDNNVDLFREKFDLLKEYSALSTFSDPNLINAGNKHIFNSAQLEDHHALIPLGRIPASANEKERNVYSLVLASFFTVCMPDYIYNEKNIRFLINNYAFLAKVREVIQHGWTETAIRGEDEDEEEQEVAPFNYSNCKLSSLRILNKKTQPKKEFSIDTLLAFMERPQGDESGRKLSGLGTPATRAEIIKTLFNRDYLSEEKKKLYVTDRGQFLLKQLSKSESLKKMADVSQTTEWEERLLQDPKAFEKEIAQFVTECVKSGGDRATFREKPLGPCPLCKKPVYETKLGYGCTGYKDEPKCPFVIWKTIAGASVSPNDASLLLIGQKTKFKKCKGKGGKAFEAAFVLKGGKVEFLFK